MKDFKPGSFCWNELMTSDVQGCKDFYKSLFGWKVEDHDLGHMTYSLIKNGEQDIGGIMQIPSGQEQHIPPHWLSYIYVENVDDAVAKAKSLGAQIKQEPVNIGDFGRMAVIQDPAGAHFALWQSLKQC